MARAAARYEIRADDKTARGTRSARRNFASVQRGVAAVNRSIRAIGAGLGALGVTLGAGALVRALTTITQKAREAADRIAKLAQQFETPPEEIALVRAAAAFAGVTAAGVETALRNVQTVIREAERGSRAYVDALREAGLTADQLKTEDAGRRLALIVAGLNGIEDAGQRSAVAIKLLGGRAFEVIRVFRPENIERAAQALGRFEATPTGRVLERAQEINDQYAETALALQGLGFALTDAFGPQQIAAIRAMNEAIAELTRTVRLLADAEGLGDAVDTLLERPSGRVATALATGPVGLLQLATGTDARNLGRLLAESHLELREQTQALRELNATRPGALR